MRQNILFLLLFLAGCRTSPTVPTSAADDLGAMSLLIERAVFATATVRCAECAGCREDFQSAFDILDFLLDQREAVTVQALGEAIGWSKVDTFTGRDGSLIVAVNGVFTAPNGGPTLAIPERRAAEAALAVWVGLNRWVGSGAAGR